MTFKTYLSVFGSDDKKHDLERKFGYKFRALESVYPNADKLPDDEIQKAIDVFYDGSPNESTDVMLNRVKDYTAKNEPMWNEKYFNPKPKPVQTSLPQPQINNLQPNMPNLMQKPKLKGFGDYDNSSNVNNLQFPTSFAKNNFAPPQPRKPQFNLSNADPYYDLKNHLINKEGNYNHMYLGKVGDLTHCVGHYDETEEETLTHPWVYKKTDIPASREEIIRNRNNILSKPTNYGVNWYKKYTNIELPDEYCYELLDNDIKSRDRELLRGIPNYSKMDSNMKQGLLEPHFTSNILNWPNLRKAATAKDRDWVCSELHRDERGRPDLIDRNKWSYDKCMQGKFIK